MGDNDARPPKPRRVVDFESYFWERVERYRGEEACWPWILKPTKNGYGQVRMEGRKRRPHHVAWILTFGEDIPDGLVLDHTCHNKSDCLGGADCPHRLCCNPAHLDAVTHAENLRRSKNIGRHNADKTHCPSGHPYSGDNLITRPNGIGRGCRTCQSLASLRYYRRTRKVENPRT